MDPMSAVILAGGEGSRLRPLTKHRPKPPIHEHVFDQLLEAGVTEIAVVGYGCNRVQAHFGSTYRNVPLTYVIQNQQLGSGHALLTAESTVDGTTIVVNGDQVVESAIISDVIEAHDADSVVATLGLLNRSDIGSYGGVILDDGEVTGIVESPRDERTYRLNTGVYAFEPTILDAIRAAEPRVEEQSLIDGIRELLESGETIRGTVSEGLWVDATYPWDLLDVSFELFEEGVIDGSQEENVAASATVHESAVVREPVVIGPEAMIEASATVRGTLSERTEVRS